VYRKLVRFKIKKKKKLGYFYFRFKGVFGEDVGAWVDAALLTLVTAKEFRCLISNYHHQIREKNLVITISGVLKHKTIL
jgi:hypothetical protein